MLALFCMTRVASAAASDTAGGKGREADAQAAPQTASSGREEVPDSAGFMIEREIQSHLEAIALYEHESSSSDAQLRDFARRILPQLRRHLALLLTLKRGIDLTRRDAPLDRRS
jgi:hypothetical protein